MWRCQQKKKEENRSTYINKTVAAKEVCDNIANQAKRRFSFTAHFSALCLFDAKKFQQYEKHFPYELIEEIIDVYELLEKDRLKTELQIIYRRSDFRNMSGAVSLLQFLIENNLQYTFSETYKLLLIVITISMTTSEAERCFSTLKMIKTFLRSTMTEGKLSALAMLSIEKSMISNIANFNETVIDLFASKKERRIDFLYQNCT